MGFIAGTLVGFISLMLSILLGLSLWTIIGSGIAFIIGAFIVNKHGHRGFGGRGNTDLTAYVFIIAIMLAIGLPQYHAAHNKIKLQVLTDTIDLFESAQLQYFKTHKKYSNTLEALSISLPDHISIVIHDDKGSITASCSHAQYDLDGDGTPDEITWEPTQPATPASNKTE